MSNFSDSSIAEAYQLARRRYADWGVDVEAALDRLAGINFSLHCWQGDDVGGFESADGLSGGGIQATGNYPGKARNADELRADLEHTFALLPGRHRLNLHGLYAEPAGGRVERNALAPEHFTRWTEWAREHTAGLDFNASFFSHPLAESGFTLSSANPAVRRFWIEHAQACRRIGASFGAALGTPCVTNIWIPDGYKDLPIDRLSPRQRLLESLDEIIAEPLPPEHNLDSVESKLFGIGSEAYVVGSHEFYLGYAASRRTLLTLDSGHFHPTEQIADKITSTLFWVPGLLLHVSRGLRWDSDHVVSLNDEVRAIAEELVRNALLDRVHIGLDYFDASINRVAAWVLGARNAIKALLIALLEPVEAIRKCEAEGDLTGRLALMEEAKSLPWSAVWDAYCARQEVPVGEAWLNEVRNYERAVLTGRG